MIFMEASKYFFIVVIGFGALLGLYLFLEPWIKGKTREQISDEEHKNFLKYKEAIYEQKEEALLNAMLDLSDKDFERFFEESLIVSDAECEKFTGLGLLDAYAVYGKASTIRKERDKK